MFNRRLRLLWPLALIIALPLMAQVRGGVTIHYAMAGPFIALIAGVLILIVRERYVNPIFPESFTIRDTC